MTTDFAHTLKPTQISAARDRAKAVDPVAAERISVAVNADLLTLWEAYYAHLEIIAAGLR